MNRDENSPCSERSAERAACGGAGVDEVDDALGLREIELAVEIRAPRELAGLGDARAELEAALQQQPQHDRAAVAVQLEHVLTRVRLRAPEKERDALVDGFAVGVAKSREHRTRGRQARGR